jgi:hypothetical protein
MSAEQATAALIELDRLTQRSKTSLTWLVSMPLHSSRQAVVTPADVVDAASANVRHLLRERNPHRGCGWAVEVENRIRN